MGAPPPCREEDVAAPDGDRRSGRRGIDPLDVRAVDVDTGERRHVLTDRLDRRGKRPEGRDVPERDALAREAGRHLEDRVRTARHAGQREMRQEDHERWSRIEVRVVPDGRPAGEHGAVERPERRKPVVLEPADCR